MNTEITVNDLVDKFNVDKTAAYGLVSFMLEAGLAKRVGERRVPGKRGRGQAVYSLNEQAVSFFESFGTVITDSNQISHPNRICFDEWRERELDE